MTVIILVFVFVIVSGTECVTSVYCKIGLSLILQTCMYSSAEAAVLGMLKLTGVWLAGWLSGWLTVIVQKV